ncbi:putative uncharacterized protein [Burkholderiales bacterium GJ-E10]|nr:putative uncharacterized protein [Burkholderiales bacterium GJ-E10]
MGIAAIGIGLLLYAGTAGSGRVPIRQDELTIPAWEALWTKVLERHVDDAGHVDFAGLARDHHDLDRVVAFVAAVDPVSQPQRFPDRSSRLAYYLDAYNALAMDGVVEAGVPASLGGWRKFVFFYLQKFAVGGKRISLYDLENDVLRPMGDERIHFVLNCMVVSCPRLPRTAFTAKALQRQLDDARRAFLAERRNVRVDRQRHEVWLSDIFAFYTRDFLDHAPSLIAYVNRYRTSAIPPGFRVRFYEYDWTVNARARVRRPAV